MLFRFQIGRAVQLQKWPRRLTIALASAFFVLLSCLILTMDCGVQFSWIQRICRVPFSDKIAHVTMYGCLAMLVNMATGLAYFKYRPAGQYSLFLQVGSAAVLTLSMAEECSQYFFPSRTLDVFDAVCNLLGITLFTVISVWILNSQDRGTLTRIWSAMSPPKRAAKLQ